MSQPTDSSLHLINNYVDKNCRRTGLQRHSMPDVSDAVIMGLASHLDEFKRPLCPCRFYPDKAEAVKERVWLCPCKDMQEFKFCHCMLFVASSDLPVTEHLPEDHDGRLTYGVVDDPCPGQGRKGQHAPPGTSGKCRK